MKSKFYSFLMCLLITAGLTSCDRSTTEERQDPISTVEHLIDELDCRKVRLANYRMPWLRPAWWSLGASSQEIVSMETILDRLSKQCAIETGSSSGADRARLNELAMLILNRAMRLRSISAAEMRFMRDTRFRRALANLTSNCDIDDSIAYLLDDDEFRLDQATFNERVEELALGNCEGEDPEGSPFGGLGAVFDSSRSQYRQQLRQCIQDVNANTRDALWEECRGMDAEEVGESNVDADGNEHAVLVEERSTSTTLHYVVCDGACEYDENGDITNPLQTTTALIIKKDDGPDYLVTITGPTDTEPGRINGRPLGHKDDPVESATDHGLEPDYGDGFKDWASGKKMTDFILDGKGWDEHKEVNPECIRIEAAPGLEYSPLVSSSVAHMPEFPSSFDDGSPFLTVDAIMMCACQAKSAAIGEEVPAATMGLSCGSEADAERLACLRNPSDPDDGPGKCSVYAVQDLRSIAGATEQCELIDCPAAQESTILGILGDQYCGCFSPEAIQGVFKGRSSTECEALNCGENACVCDESGCGCKGPNEIWTSPVLGGLGSLPVDH